MVREGTLLPDFISADEVGVYHTHTHIYTYTHTHAHTQMVHKGTQLRDSISTDEVEAGDPKRLGE